MYETQKVSWRLPYRMSAIWCNILFSPVCILREEYLHYHLLMFAEWTEWRYIIQLSYMKVGLPPSWVWLSSSDSRNKKCPSLAHTTIRDFLLIFIYSLCKHLVDCMTVPMLDSGMTVMSTRENLCLYQASLMFSVTPDLPPWPPQLKRAEALFLCDNSSPQYLFLLALSWLHSQ